MSGTRLQRPQLPRVAQVEDGDPAWAKEVWCGRIDGSGQVRPVRRFLAFLVFWVDGRAAESAPDLNHPLGRRPKRALAYVLKGVQV